MFRRLTVPGLMGQALALAMLMVWAIALSSVWGSVGGSGNAMGSYAFLVFWMSYPLLILISWFGLSKEVKASTPSRVKLAVYHALPLVWVVITVGLVLYSAATAEHYE